MSDSPRTPAGWHADPYRRYSQRWWDGAGWTERVSDGSGRAFVDPSGADPIGVPANPDATAAWPQATPAGTAAASAPKTLWYHNPIAIVIAAMLCFPVAIAMVWTNPAWVQKTRLIWTGAIVAFIVAIGVASALAPEPEEEVRTLAAPLPTSPTTERPPSSAGTTAATSTAPATTATPQTTIPATTAAPTTVTVPPTVAPPPTEPPAPAIMPNVVCMNLQEAQDTIQLAGVFFSRSEDATGQGRNQFDDSNWIVVGQNLSPGEEVGELEAVLAVVKYGEPNPC